MPDEQTPPPQTPGRRTNTWRREPTELVEFNHDRRAFGLAMGSIAVAVVVGVAVILWVTGGHGGAGDPPRTTAADPPSAATAPTNAQVLSVAIRDPLAGAAFTVGARIPVLVVASSGQSPLAEIIFSLDGLVVGRRRAAPYGFSLDALPLGIHRLGARAVTEAGDGIDAAEVEVHIVPPPTRPPAVQLGAATGMTPVGLPWMVPASIRPGDVALARVQLSEDGVVLSECTRDPWLLSWTPDRAGRRKLAITVTDADGRQDAVPFELLAYGDGGRILIGHRPADALRADGDGVLDWLVLGARPDGTAVRRAGQPLLRWEALGAARPVTDPRLPGVAWQGGEPLAQGDAHHGALEWNGAGHGARLLVPAGTAPRLLTLLLSGKGALTLELDDASTAPLRDESLGNADGWQQVTVEVRSGSAQAHLVVGWTALAGPVRLAAAVLRER